MRLVSFLLCLLCATPSQACDTALVLAIDVSNSVDPDEFRIQTDGIADALLDPEIREALVLGQSALTVVQWSGPDEQVISIPWKRIRTETDADQFSAEARAIRREIINSNTAIGSAMSFSYGLFADMGDCARHVIDISGDGAENAGTTPERVRLQAERSGIEINGLAIERIGIAITNFYRLKVITRNGFVMTARGHTEYAETLKEKMRRELSKAIAALD